jgi:hypothetical protein
LIPQRVVLIPLATTLVAAVIASVLGGWIYDRVDRPGGLPARGRQRAAVGESAPERAPPTGLEP